MNLIIFIVLPSCVGFPDKPSSWMTVDTALFVMSAGEAKEDSALVCFTESRDREVCLRVKGQIRMAVRSELITRSVRHVNKGAPEKMCCFFLHKANVGVTTATKLYMFMC